MTLGWSVAIPALDKGKPSPGSCVRLPCPWLFCVLHSFILSVLRDPSYIFTVSSAVSFCISFTVLVTLPKWTPVNLIKCDVQTTCSPHFLLQSALTSLDLGLMTEAVTADWQPCHSADSPFTVQQSPSILSGHAVAKSNLLLIFM